ncbi:MAG: anhydro-N-acetylmuramic acid kinase [Flavitalea sp.]
MVYRVIGLMSGSSLDGLDIVFAEFQDTAGKWKYNMIHFDLYEYTHEWQEKLRTAYSLSALEYQLLHTAYGHYLGEQVNHFIKNYGLDFKVQLIASHGHTVFHMPSKRMTAQIGDGAAIAAETGINVVSDLRSLDVALGGHGAPIVPIGEKLLLSDYNYFLNIGGIANLSVNGERYTAFDVCPANRVLNLIAKEKGLQFDDEGKLAAAGTINNDLLNILNSLEYYSKPYPKSLDNSFGTDTIYPILQGVASSEDRMATYAEHIAVQVSQAVKPLAKPGEKLLVTGGGAHNHFLIERLNAHLKSTGLTVEVPEQSLVVMKEALIMGFIGLLRWREEFNVLSSVTGASRNSIGGAVYMGQEA